jgi:apolipoprotein D and lipocalin family protein
MKHFLALLFISLSVAGCTGIPKGVTPVSDFELNRYLGKWYEIARLDHSFERGLKNVTAEYSMRDDGGVRVSNTGYSVPKQKWKMAEGKACFVGEPTEGRLKVSFFGPFYGSYIVYGLDKQNYQHAFVSGPSYSYLWLLARAPTVSKELINEFVESASQLGFETEDLIYVNQDPILQPNAAE